MNIASFVRCAVGGAGLAIALVACSGTRSLPTATAAVAPLSVDGSRAALGAKKKKKTQLLYISDNTGGNILSFSYRQGKLKNTLRGFGFPYGLCAAGSTVWVANSLAENLVQYKYNGVYPARIVSVNGGTPVDCAYDATTKHFAVAIVNTPGTPSGPGGVWIYTNANAKGTPVKYSVPHMPHPNYVAYDDKSDLFVDGTGANNSFQFAELPKGASAFVRISLSGASITGNVGNIQWDGKQMTIGTDNQPVAIYRLKIKGTTATVIGTTSLDGAIVCDQYVIQGKKVVVPESFGSKVEFYNYPAGGSPTKTLTGFNMPFGAAIVSQ